MPVKCSVAEAELIAQEPWLEDAETAVTWWCCQMRFVCKWRITRTKQWSSSIPTVKYSGHLCSLKDSRDACLILFSLFWFIPFSKCMGYTLFSANVMSALTCYVFYEIISVFNGHNEFDSGLIWFTQVIYVVMIQHLNDGSDRKSVPLGQTWADW